MQNPGHFLAVYLLHLIDGNSRGGLAENGVDIIFPSIDKFEFSPNPYISDQYSTPGLQFRFFHTELIVPFMFLAFLRMFLRMFLNPKFYYFMFKC
jgi:hypothetical protein